MLYKALGDSGVEVFAVLPILSDQTLCCVCCRIRMQLHQSCWSKPSGATASCNLQTLEEEQQTRTRKAEAGTQDGDFAGRHSRPLAHADKSGPMRTGLSDAISELYSSRSPAEVSQQVTLKGDQGDCTACLPGRKRCTSLPPCIVIKGLLANPEVLAPGFCAVMIGYAGCFAITCSCCHE